MAIEMKATCDAYGCTNEIDLPVDAGPSIDVEMEYFLKYHGWVKDTDSNYCYCNRCFPKVKAELDSLHND